MTRRVAEKLCTNKVCVAFLAPNLTMSFWRLSPVLSSCLSKFEVDLVAPYCAIPRDYLSDTPLLRAMGFLVSQHGQLGAIPPPPFLSVSPLERACEVEVRYPSLKRGISAILARYPTKTRKWVRYPPLRYYLERVLQAIWGGISHWAATEVDPCDEGNCGLVGCSLLLQAFWLFWGPGTQILHLSFSTPQI